MAPNEGETSCAEDPVHVEETRCLMCGDPPPEESHARGFDYEYETSAREFLFVECPRCGHVYLNPRPCIADAAAIYPSNYYTLTGAQRGLLGPVKDMVLMRRLRALLRDVPKGGVAVEVGCGDGTLLLAMRRARPDLRLVGVDLQFTDRHRRSLEDAGIECKESMMEEAAFSVDFDFAVMNQLIEHLWDVPGCLARISGCLKPGGQLSISTPNLRGWDRRFFSEATWGGYYFPRHLNLFTPDRLERLLDQFGFEVVRVENLVGPLIWIASCHNTLKARNSRLRRFFFDGNMAALAVFTALDTAAKLLGKETSNMQVIARKCAGNRQ